MPDVVTIVVHRRSGVPMSKPARVCHMKLVAFPHQSMLLLALLHSSPLSFNRAAQSCPYFMYLELLTIDH